MIRPGTHLLLVLGTLLVGIVLVAPALATDARYQTALRLFHAGAFDTARAVATGLGTADGFALAARAASAEGAYLAPEGSRRAHFEDAEHLCQAALALKPNHIEARMQLVVAIGHRSRTMTPLRAYFSGLATKARTIIDSLATTEDDNPFFHAIVGAWHAEAVHRGGATAAAQLLGADLGQAIRSFERALSIDPDNILILIEYAKVLLRHPSVSSRTRAMAILARAQSLPATSYLERAAQSRAKLIGDGTASVCPPKCQSPPS